MIIPFFDMNILISLEAQIILMKLIISYSSVLPLKTQISDQFHCEEFLILLNKLFQLSEVNRAA